MLSKTIKDSLIQLKIEANGWEDAIRKSADPLLKEKMITEEYVGKIIEITKTAGPYIVITKHTALPHAPSNCGANKLAIGITTLEIPVISGHLVNDPVKYLFCLSAPDNSSHLESLSNLVPLLDDENFFRVLDNASEPKEILEYIKNKELEL